MLLLCLLLPLHLQGKERESARRLVKLLTEMQQREEVEPDSFYADVQLLRQEIHACKDDAQQAIYRATLARLLTQNAWRAQEYERETQSDPDSLQEWTTREYQHEAAQLYTQALQDMPLLHRTPTREWIPLVQRGRDEAVWGSDMLSVVWSAYRQDVNRDDAQRWQCPGAEKALAVYEAEGMDEAVIRLTLEEWNERFHYQIPRDSLLALRDAHAPSDACALIYQRLADACNDSVPQQKAYLEEALQRYPKWRQRNELKNRLRDLQAPVLSVQVRDIYYPGQEMLLPMEVRNMSQVKLTWYELPQDFDEESLREDLLLYVRREGKRMNIQTEGLQRHAAEELWHDTLRAMAPECGRYAVVMEGSGNMKLQGKPTPCVKAFCTSRLHCFLTNLPERRARLTVVDALSGEPLAGVTADVNLMTQKGSESLQSHVITAQTDARGVVEWKNAESKYYRSFLVGLTRPGDEALDKIVLGGGRMDSGNSPQERQNVRIYTDRSIYRPGQTVYVGALAYTQQGWEGIVKQDAKYTLTMLDANRQQVLTHSLQTDEMGVMSDTLQLPESALPGTYTIKVGVNFYTFEVEEYRRPTFEVKILGDQALVKDGCVTIPVQAKNYSDTPVSGGRVTGSCTLQNHWRFNPKYHYHQSQTMDTLYTDPEGNAVLSIPLPDDEHVLKAGLMLRVKVDVLSPAGETQHQEYTLSCSTTPLRIDGTWTEIQYRENLPAWELNLTSALGRPVEGTIQCTLRNKGQEAASFSIKANQKEYPQVLKTLPSGCYELEARAEVEGDTASMRKKLCLVGMDDTVVVDDSPLWLNCADATFGPGKAARIQVGSTLPDAWIYLTIPAKDHLAVDTLLHLENRMVTLEIPYREGFDKLTCAVATLCKDGIQHTKQINLKVARPDVSLRPHWDTFRDHLRPGQQEEWRLTLQNPDGTAARANVLLSMYDASLDAIRSHQITFQKSTSYYGSCFNLSVNSSPNNSETMHLPMSIRYLRVREAAFSCWNPMLSLGGGMMTYAQATGTKNVRIRGRALYEASAPVRKYAVALANTSVETASLDGMSEEDTQGTIAGQDTTDNPVGEENENIADAATENEPLLRGDMRELAFFEPKLRTNAEGQVSISFTLPESITRWHLQGFAHTEELNSVNLEESIVAQKELMAELNLPRFLREGDRGTFRASVRNLSNQVQKGTCNLKILDAESGKVLRKEQMRFELEPQGVQYFDLQCVATEEHPLMVVQWSAQGKDVSDGEQRYLPVLSRMQPVTETKAFCLTGKQESMISLEKLFGKDNSSAVNRTLTVEYTRNPKWLALMTLPSLSQPRCQDVLSLSSAFYASSLAYYLAHRYPGMQQCVSRWAQEEHQSTLEKNQELTDMMLQETPWVMESEAEKERRSNVVKLFDEAAQQSHRSSLLNQIKQLQTTDGAFRWFPGMKESDYLTREVAYQLARLLTMTGDSLSTAQSHEARLVLFKAIGWLQNDVARQIQAMKEMKNPGVTLSQLRYLYLLKESGYTTTDRVSDDAEYLVNLLSKMTKSLEPEEKALAAIVLQQYGEQKQAKELMNDLRERMNHPDGFYLSYPSGNKTSIDRKMQTHVQIMEAWTRVLPKEVEPLQQMQQWILQQKRTQEWEQPVQTANAVYALTTLMPDEPEEKGTDILLVKDGRQTRLLESPETEEGYLRSRVEDLKSPKSLVVHKSGEGTSWGAVYAQYQIPGSEMEAQREGLAVRCDLPKEEWKLGDRVVVRYTLTVDKDYEYVCLHTDRPSLTEPTDQLSGYKYLGGVGCYKAVHDASTDYFFNRLPRGTYVIEEVLSSSYSGSCSMGGASLKCLYAPEYQGHSQGIQVTIKPSN